MRKVIFSFAAISVLLLSGCSHKTPMIEDGSNTGGDVIIDTPDDMSGVNTGTDSLSGSQLIQSLKSELGSVYFDFDRFNIRPDMQQVVSNDANVLNREESSSFTIKLEGNCDEWGTDEYNMALGLKRAMTVKQSLISKGIDPNRIKTVSYGENNPVCTQKTKSCWSQNRRVDFDLFQ